MDIELLYFDGCPNWQRARDLLADALAATGNASTPIVLRTVATPEDAQREGFPGSPTIRIDGADPFTSTGAAALACRVYRGHGCADGLPDLSSLIAAIRRSER
ncbi:thioredoxin family protein [Rhodococcus yananensis]|uniref:thioredoxin family protein n=1 Tax=Rhodococcus yananensis TaxID=2879464 RepID=UPI001CF8AE96|nr:thioredoxin family protein [Rhodococcus yananensis]